MLRSIFRGQQHACFVRMQRIGDLLEYMRPEFQRTVNETHVEELMRDIREDWNRLRALTVLQSISVARLADGSHYILDGSHRMTAFSRLASEMPHLRREELPVVVYHCRSNEEVLHWYARINHHLPIHPMELELAWAEKVRPLLEHIQRRYRVYLSKSTAPQCPNLHLPHIQTALQERANQLQSDALTAAGLVEDVEALHREILRRLPYQLSQNPRLEKCLQKQPEDPCFLGYWRHGEWIDLLLYRRLRGVSWETLPWTSFETSGALSGRKAIPKALRRQVWAKTNDPDRLTGKCYVCDEPLEFDVMECAHNVPHCLGGGSHLENLWPSCRSCNRDMGIRTLEEYAALLRRLRGSETDSV